MITGKQLGKLTSLLACASLMACSQGFKAETSAINDGNITMGDGSQVSVEKAWTDVETGVNGTVQGGTNNGTLVVQIDKARQSIVLILPLPPIFLLPAVGMPIPEMPGASIEMTEQPDGSKAMGVVIPLSYLIKGAALAEYGKLPNGDDIPFIPVGEARGFSISFPQKPKYRLHLYIAANAAAAFIETPDWQLPPELSMIPIVGFPVKNQSQTQVVGYFGLVPNRGSFSSGVYVASRIPRQLAILIDELLRY